MLDDIFVFLETHAGVQMDCLKYKEYHCWAIVFDCFQGCQPHEILLVQHEILPLRLQKVTLECLSYHLIATLL